MTKNPFSDLPGNLGERAAALVAKRETQGCNVHFLNDRGQYDRFSFSDPERARRFADARRREGGTVFADEHEAHDHERAAKAAYDEDCARNPFYCDGRPRKSWEQLGEIERESWMRNPTPRNWN